MANLQTLSNVEHKDVKIISELRPEFGDAVGGALVFPSELIAVQREFPILFQKEPESGILQLIALFGFQSDENLFLESDGWTARYTPLLMRKDPFFIGLKENPNASGEPEMLIQLDLDSARVVTDGSEGQALFLPGGGFTPYLDDVKKTLLGIHRGLSEAKILTDLLLEHDLLETFTLDAQFSDGGGIKTDSYYTINTDKLYSLPQDLIAEMHSKGYLQLIYLIHFSFGNIQNLVNRKNQLLKNAI